jgi:transposase-like protein
MDKHGQTIACLLAEQRDQEAALRFLKKAIVRNELPETITIDGSKANASAMRSSNEAHGTTSVIRQVQYFNNIVEQNREQSNGSRVPGSGSSRLRPPTTRWPGSISYICSRNGH